MSSHVISVGVRKQSVRASPTSLHARLCRKRQMQCDGSVRGIEFRFPYAPVRILLSMQGIHDMFTTDIQQYLDEILRTLTESGKCVTHSSAL
jgi:hypothetical protein